MCSYFGRFPFFNYWIHLIGENTLRDGNEETQACIKNSVGGVRLNCKMILNLKKL